MDKKLYNIISIIPFIGPIIQIKTNFFSLVCSPYLEELSKTGALKEINKWVSDHPDKILSPKIAKDIIRKYR